MSCLPVFVVSLSLVLSACMSDPGDPRIRRRKSRRVPSEVTVSFYTTLGRAPTAHVSSFRGHPQPEPWRCDTAEEVYHFCYEPAGSGASDEETWPGHDPQFDERMAACNAQIPDLLLSSGHSATPVCNEQLALPTECTSGWVEYPPLYFPRILVSYYNFYYFDPDMQCIVDSNAYDWDNYSWPGTVSAASTILGEEAQRAALQLQCQALLESERLDDDVQWTCDRSAGTCCNDIGYCFPP